MKLLNRSGLSIRPRQPFVDWVHSFSDSAPSLEALAVESMLYLIDEVEQESDFEAAIELHWLAIFKNELEAWDEFGDHWPTHLSRELFETWFELDRQLLSFDLSQKDLMRASIRD